MSSAVYISLNEPIGLREWLELCRDEKLFFSPQTAGQNTFYRDQVEVIFGSDEGFAPKGKDGGFVWEDATPPARAFVITVSSYWGLNLSSIAALASAIAARWPSHVECAEELRHLFAPCVRWMDGLAKRGCL